MSLNYALLADIYPESKKNKKNKKSNALSPENPDFKMNKELYHSPTINSKIDQLGYNPYEDPDSQTPHYVRFNQKNNPNTVIDDKDYVDFLEWKKNKYESKPHLRIYPLRPRKYSRLHQNLIFKNLMLTMDWIIVRMMSLINYFCIFLRVSLFCFYMIIFIN